jgi:hypothetical protein
MTSFPTPKTASGSVGILSLMMSRMHSLGFAEILGMHESETSKNIHSVIQINHDGKEMFNHGKELGCFHHEFGFVL